MGIQKGKMWPGQMNLNEMRCINLEVIKKKVQGLALLGTTRCITESHYNNIG